LRQTTMSDVRLKLALRNALESEAEFVEPEDADEQLLTLLRKPLPRPSSTTSQKQDEQGQKPPSSASGNRKPGKRTPGRDATGATAPEEENREQTDEERAAG
jgi:hypothetical protein